MNNYGLYEFFYPHSRVRQIKKLISHSAYLKTTLLEPELQDEAIRTLSEGNEWFTDRSPLYAAIETGRLQCNGEYRVVIKKLWDKESIYELQKIDCNCNNCFFLKRDIEKYYAVLEQDKKDQLWLFENKKRRAFEKANELIKRNREKGLLALEAANKLSYSYQGDPNPTLYGKCKKFDKDVSFRVNTCQLDTQDCFLHRKDAPLPNINPSQPDHS